MVSPTSQFGAAFANDTIANASSTTRIIKRTRDGNKTQDLNLQG